ncbi:Fe-S oxidoreductase [Candidatus Kryptonium thompsonii]|uniref:Fe-S oxidoreductase n=1 Tax=Candidatus Kryptonium thompsonii TaxID=1633631 RepID=A0A0P1L5W3_9BACT|nr:(Fe-S)-binding protein [Candidatus Kryptonium thompsoni]CUS76441.1 Fe-S oxidoreductase [Candidatus Kryptonium thompsoni]CUS76555.1 Fe-S oxidoreductase [Candidatus Kryptonium thompsoni]CUS79677.1 Fe-S oxidoreductase [Candidatus Kryptonium thompsoni]CUS80463.1 Fe-S oxidoreductase [Candidatus Kryptonium thompsoni]CUS92807.1 Fe-S oxidoreductase [Candidatus Kryptonium thompsoni]
MANNGSVQKALEILEKQLNQPLKTALEVCARCGICAEACHYYVAEPKVEHVPAYRAEQLRKIYRKKHNFFGKYVSWLVDAEELDDEKFNKLVEMAFSECTLCRRCTFNCPLGVDTPLVMRTIRAMATATGKAPEILVMLADSAIAKGENPEIFKEMFLQQISQLEKELQELTGNPEAKIPVEKKGARVLYVGLAGAHTIIPPAIIFNEVGEDWTLSIYEAANYGVFLGDVERAKKIAKRIIDEAKRLKVQEVVVAECGHACAALVWDAPNWFAEKFPFRIRSVVEVVAEYIQKGKLTLDPKANSEPVTYHDSCNLARTGGIFREPRIILKAVVKDFREMNPNGIENYCCGGGGGLVALPEYYEKRMRAGKPKAEQIKRTGAKIVAAACENCKLQLGDLNNYYNLGVEVKGLVDLVANAILYRKKAYASSN